MLSGVRVKSGRLPGFIDLIKLIDYSILLLRYWWDQYVKHLSMDILEDICHQVSQAKVTYLVCESDISFDEEI